MNESTRIRPGMILALISIPIFIGALDLTVVSAVLPHVIVDLEIPLQTGLDDAAWMVTGYLLVYSISMTFMGRLSDLYGRRRIYLIALAIFAFGSYLVAVADAWPTRLVLRVGYLFATGRFDVSYVTLYVLIAARMIQAFGAGTMVPVGMALVGDIFPMNRRAGYLGLIAAVDTAGWVVGHLYGGIIVRFWSWSLIFWLNIPVCALAFILIWLMLRNLPQERSRGRMDWLGAVLIATSLSLLNLGLGDGSDNTVAGSDSRLPPYALPLIILFAVTFILFLWRQRTAQHPLVDLSLFKRENYLTASLINLFVGFSLFVAIANVPLFINSLIARSLEQGAWESGWMLSTLTVPMALASVPGGWLSDRYGYRFPTLLGLSLSIIGFVFMRTWTIDTPYSTMAFHLIFGGIGIGLTMAPIAAAVVNISPADQHGTSSAMVIIFRLIGMTVGVSSITTYDLLRVDTLSRMRLSSTPTLGETVRVGMEVTEKVISETFVIAGFVALAALFLALKLRNNNRTSEVKHE